MTFVPELQADLHLCSVSLAPKGGLEVVVRNVVENRTPSPVGRHHTDVMSYPTIFAPSQTFRISFARYITFSVGAEEYVLPYEYNIVEGRSFRRFTRSRFLDYLEKNTYGSDVRPGFRYHYGIYCLNELVNVVSSSAPNISSIGDTAL